MADISGFVDPSTTSQGGFSFQSFLSSVGSSLNQWAVSAIDRQVNKDTAERPAVNAPSLVDKAKSFFSSPTGIAVGVAVAIGGWFLYKKLKLHYDRNTIGNPTLALCESSGRIHKQDCFGFDVDRS